MSKLLRISEAAYLLGVSLKTVRRWTNTNKLDCIRTIGGHRRFHVLEIKRVLKGEQKKSRIEKPAIYARVSSHEQKQKGDLDRQIEALKEYCKTKIGVEPVVYRDIGSGLNTQRKRFLKLCHEIEQQNITTVYDTYPDRLTRFGFNYLASYFHSHGAKITVVNQKPDSTLEEELVQDVIAIITAFSGRVHGLRSAKARKLKKELQQELLLNSST